jgi:uncharacterized protein (TIGR02246 family)
VTDEEQVRQLLALWGQRHADKDAAGWSQLFAEDGVYVTPRGDRIVGRAAIQQYAEERYGSSRRHFTHLFGAMDIRVDGDAAESTVDYASCQRDPEANAVLGSLGRHYHRLVRQAGRWLYAEYRIVNVPDRLPSLDRRDSHAG